MLKASPFWGVYAPPENCEKFEVLFWAEMRPFKSNYLGSYLT